jgi:hypothetical protein
VWLQFLLAELNITLHHTLSCSFPIYGALTLMLLFSHWTLCFMPALKIEINYHFVWERVLSKDLIIHFLSFHDQIVDIPTKALSSPGFTALQSSAIQMKMSSAIQMKMSSAIQMESNFLFLVTTLSPFVFVSE